MNPAETSQAIFDSHYQLLGLKAQRLYPNESLLQFLGGNYFHLPMEERSKIRILEIGCGSGANLWMMAKEGFQVYGMDSSAKALEVAGLHLMEKWNVSATLTKGSFLDLPYDTGSFDAIVDVVSLQHIGLEDSRLALREVARVLRPGGKFFSFRLSDHSVMFSKAADMERIDSCTLANISDPSLPLANNGPVSFWSPALARMLYEEAGLSLLNVSLVTRTYADAAVVEYLAIEATNETCAPNHG
ncbi:MAG: class I SAM-dependent methyltransferase [Terrimicrobiaceae bacterium]